MRGVGLEAEVRCERMGRVDNGVRGEGAGGRNSLKSHGCGWVIPSVFTVLSEGGREEGSLHDAESRACILQRP